MSIQNEIDDLVKEGIINSDTASKIQDYFDQKSNKNSNRLFVVFGILGALLVGFGIIMIIAHNWDNYPRYVKLVFAFIPLLISQGLGLFVILKKQESVAWKETVGTLIFFGIGSSIALVSQIYNIPGDLSSFLFTWCLLALPVVYILRSSAASLIYIAFISYFSFETLGMYRSFGLSHEYFWILFACILPYYAYLFKRLPNSNFLKFHNWMIPISLGLGLIHLTDLKGWLSIFVYVVLGSLYYGIGNLPYFQRQKLINNSYKVLGVIGSTILLFILSYEYPWKGRLKTTLDLELCSSQIGFWIMILCLIMAIAFWGRKIIQNQILKTRPFDVFMIVIMFLGLTTTIAKGGFIATNIFILLTGIFYILDGLKKDNLQRLNYGLIVTCLLIGMRFMDSNISLVLKGVVFVSLGAAFFATNTILFLKRKKDDEKTA